MQPSAGLVRADGWAVESILANLIENALRAEPEGGAVLVRVRRCARSMSSIMARASPSKDRDAIFEPFWRKSDATRGAGLGLAIAKELMDGTTNDIGSKKRRAAARHSSSRFEAKGRLSRSRRAQTPSYDTMLVQPADARSEPSAAETTFSSSAPWKPQKRIRRAFHAQTRRCEQIEKITSSIAISASNVSQIAPFPQRRCRHFRRRK